MHYHDDLMSSAADSWRSRLLAANITFEAIPDGIGALPCVGDIFCDHIREALSLIPL